MVSYRTWKCSVLRWLVVLVAAFTGRASHAILITELAYNPGANGSPSDALEFVEVYNDSPVVVDLSGAHFSKGIEFVFPEGSFLKARSAIAVCANLAAMKAQYPQANLIGDYSGKLDNGGETVALVTRSGSPLAEVSYKDRGLWPASTDGTGYTLSLISPLDDASDPASWSRSGLPGGTPGAENFSPPAIIDNEIFPEIGPASAWRYRKGYNEGTQLPEDFSSPSSAWRALAFDDLAWPEGPAPIGYGEAEIATSLSDMDGHYGSFAARKRFQISQANLDEMLSITFSIHVDDGFVAFLNGEEIGRLGLDAALGADAPFDALAVAARELKSAKPYVIPIQKDRVKLGENVLAVQVHNRRLTESNGDCGFSGTLAYQTRVVYAPVPSPGVVLNEVISMAPSALRGVELYNTLPSSVQLGGYTIALGPERSATYTVQAGTSISSHGFLFVPEQDLGFTLGGEITLLLLEPDGIVIADAISVSDSVPPPDSPRSHVRIRDGKPQLGISTIPTPGAANKLEVEQGLVINEIHYNPKLLLPTNELDPNPEKGEYIELYNRSSAAIALDGYRMTSGFQFSFPADTRIEAGKYLVIARNPKFIRETYGLGPAEVLGPPEDASEAELADFGALRNRGERIRIVDTLGNTVDEVEFKSEGEWDELADGGGSSLELIDPNQDNGSPSAWQASDERHKTQWTELTYTAKNVLTLVPAPQESELHIYFISEGEMLIDGVSLTQGDPPAEVIPNGDFETDAKPWRLIGTHVRSLRTTDEAKIGSASLRVVSTGSGDNRVNRIEVDTVPALKAGDVTFKMWARWIQGSNAVHVSGHNNAFGRTLYLPVPAAQGTPGRENSARAGLRLETGSDNLGPVLSKVLHEPAVPAAQEPIHIRAQVTDADGIASVEVLHQKDGDATFQSVPLLDDGAHGDGDAGDGVYGGDVPGYAKSLVNYYVEATDSLGHKRAFPRKAPERTLLLAVDDKIQSAVARYRLLVNQKEMNTPVTGLARRLLHSDELVRGTFIFEESEVYYDVGVRYHGSPWNRPPDPKMFRVRFNADKPFVDGVKRINISRYGGSQNEGTAYQLLAEAGRADFPVPHSQRYTYINMKLNTAVHGSGALSEIRPIDTDYMSFNWPNDSDGQAYKITGKLAFTDGGTMAGGGPDWTALKTYSTGPYPGDINSPENYRFYFNTTVKLDEDDFKPLIALLKTMDRAVTPDAGYDDAIQKIMNVESSLRVFAVRSLLADWDTVDIGNGQNAYLYYAPIEGRHYLVPWDMDHTFERNDVAIAPGNGTFGFRRLLNRPIFRRQYARILSELQTSSWSDQYLGTWFKLVAETTTPGKVAPGTGLQTFIRGRRTMVDTFLRSGINISFAVTSPNPTGAAGDTATLQGTGGIEIAFILAQVGDKTDPVQLTPTWSSPPKAQTAIPSIWQAAVSGLAPGKNDVSIFGLDIEGNLVGSTNLSVYNTTGWAAPTLANVSPGVGGLVGGTPITLHGTGFQPGLRIDLGGKPATDVVVLSAEQATAKTPAGAQEGPVDVAAVNLDGQASTLAGAFNYTGSLPFQRGDVDGNGKVDQTDAIDTLLYLFLAGSLTCGDAADIDDNGELNITDPILLLRYLFQGGGAPASPFEAAGVDPTPDGLGCGV